MNPRENSVMENLDFSETDRFFKTIGEVSAEIGIPPHVLRFWESKFLNIKPHKRKGGHRYYSKVDVEAIYEIKRLLYEQGFTIKGAQKYLREKGYMQHQDAQDQQSLFSEVASDKVAVVRSSNPNPSQPDLLAESVSSPALDLGEIKSLLKELEQIKKTLETSPE